MAQANKTRWNESWAGINGEVQVTRHRITEDADYNEIEIVTLYPIAEVIESITPVYRNRTGGVGLLVEG